MNLLDELAQQVAESITDELDETARRKLGVLTAAALGFCSEPETYPVFLDYLVRSYERDGETDAAEKIRLLKREDFSVYVLLLIDPRIVSHINERLNPDAAAKG